MKKTAKPETPKPVPPVTLRRMPDGSYRIYGLRNNNRIHLTKEMRPWRREDDEQSGEIYYVSWSREEAETYAAAHGLTIIGPTTS